VSIPSIEVCTSTANVAQTLDNAHEAAAEVDLAAVPCRTTTFEHHDTLTKLANPLSSDSGT
jgi:hypothetical protein